MLNDIRMHVDGDDTVQRQIEASQANIVEQHYAASMRAFKQHVPSVFEQLSQPSNTPYALFVNKHAQFNIVDYGSGKTFYGLHPPTEVAAQLDQLGWHASWLSFAQDPDLTSLSDNKGPQGFDHSLLYAEGLSQTLNADNVDVLVILGVGLGSHILPLLQHHRPKHVVFYETDIGILRASVLAENWQTIFSFMASSDICCYFQIGSTFDNKAASIFDDLKQLSTHFDCKNALIFKHFDSVLHNAIANLIKSLSWQDLQNIERVSPNLPTIVNDVPMWNSGFDYTQWQLANCKHPTFEKNLNALQQTYPDLYHRFKDYQPSAWQVVTHPTFGINAFNTNSAVALHGNNAQQESQALFYNFNHNPNRDGLIIGYRGDKNRHFLHNHLVIRTESIINRLESKADKHPDNSKALIMFGLGLGYGFETLLQSKTIEQLFIFEPNPDFFYASLYALDWQAIFDKVENDKSYLYLNIGDDGSNFASDMMAHFYRIGPYALNETYLFKGYENHVLNPIIEKLRDQLKLMIAMSENFDHSVTGIQQSLSAIEQRMPFLAHDCAKRIKPSNFEVPIFVVGNGPSLDSSIEAIKQYQGQAIIVSCGTALQSLYKHNIVPDFHAEIEQYRSTFDWAFIIDAPDYLKQITLISCNGIHPDTCRLYKDVKLAFKDGEASTRAIQDIIGKSAFKSLETAYPTVSNFVLSFFLSSGFTNLYLIGTDLGFVDIKHHHSRGSAYFTSTGKETFDYADLQNISLQVRGNFRPYVNTKTEFDLARMSMEKAILSARSAICYNTSDGAYIKGAQPLDIDAILILTSQDDKKEALHAFNECFVTIDPVTFLPEFSKKYDKTKLLDAVDVLILKSQTVFVEISQIRQFIDDVRQLILNNYEIKREQKSSLFFFYYHSMTNSINALLTKVMMQQDAEFALETANQILSVWHDILLDSKVVCNKEKDMFDSSSTFSLLRETTVLKKLQCDTDIHLVLPQNTCLSKDDYNEYLNACEQHCQNQVSMGVNAKPDAVNIVILDSFASLEEFERSSLQRCQEISDGAKKTHYLLVLINVNEDWQNNIARLTKYPQYTLMWSPPLFDQFNKSDLMDGRVPLMTLNVLLGEAIKRALEAPQHKMFIIKPRFCKDGLKTAYTKKLDEFSTEACEFIDGNVMFFNTSDHFIDYRTYIAMRRNLTKDDVKHGSILSVLASRGQLFERNYRARDLLGVWFTKTAIEALY